MKKHNRLLVRTPCSLFFEGAKKNVGTAAALGDGHRLPASKFEDCER